MCLSLHTTIIVATQLLLIGGAQCYGDPVALVCMHPVYLMNQSSHKVMLAGGEMVGLYLLLGLDAQPPTPQLPDCSSLSLRTVSETTLVF